MSSLMDRLKQNRGKQVDALKESAKSKGGFQKDERIWKYSGVATDKLTEKGKKQQYSRSVIRILPTSFADMKLNDEGKLAEHQTLSPIVTVFRNNFNVNGKYFNELNRREMLGEECPINEYDQAGWAAWKEAGKPEGDTKKKLVDRLPKSEYYANILVIEDHANPENEGKVFLFRFTQAIMGIINEGLEPSMPGKDPVDPFDIYEGQNLRLEFMMPEQKFGSWTGFAPKDIPKESGWLPPSPLAETDEEIEEIMSKAYSLMEFTDIKLFKSYDQLSKRFSEVMGFDTTVGDNNNTVDVPANQGEAGGDKSSAPKNNVEEVDLEQTPTTTTTTEEDDGTDEFERMLRESANT